MSLLLDLNLDISEIKNFLQPPAVPSVGPAGHWINSREIIPAESQATLEDVEKEQIQKALREVRGNRRKAAAALGISERTLYRKIREYNLG